MSDPIDSRPPAWFWVVAVLGLLSLVAVILQSGGWLLATDAIRVIGPSVFAMPAAIVAVAILLAWFATLAARPGWLA